MLKLFFFLWNYIIRLHRLYLLGRRYLLKIFYYTFLLNLIYLLSKKDNMGGGSTEYVRDCRP